MIVETARALGGRGHDVTVLTSGWKAPRPGPGGMMRTVWLRRRFASPARHEISFALRAVPHLVRGRYDAVHCMMPWDAYFASMARPLAGHRVVYEELGIPYRLYWATGKVDPVRRRIVERVDVYGCMSKYAADVLEKEWGRAGTVIPGGVRLGDFRPARTRAGRPTILFSGALTEPRKGLSLLLDAVALLARRVPDVEVWLSGPGDPSGILASAPPAAAERVEVLPLGEPQDQARRYAEAWVTCLPSKFDSFGLVLIESLASGTPIVVLDHAAPPELVLPGTGAVAGPDDPAALAAALESGLDLAARPGTAEACRASALPFDWDSAIAPLLEGLYGQPGR